MRLFYPRLTTLALAALVLAPGCTAENPDYDDAFGAGDRGADLATDRGPAVEQPPKKDSRPDKRKDKAVKDLPRDKGPKLDQKADKPKPDVKQWPDTKPWPDLVPWPDSKPWACKKHSDCNDSNKCTADLCTAKHVCSNMLLPGYCLVAGKCHFNGTTNPKNSCQICSIKNSTKAWTTRANGSPCYADKTTCTDDVCKSGQCLHPVKANWCLIGSACHIKGKWNPKNVCQHCDPTKSTATWSNRADGAACNNDGLPCTADKCKTGSCAHTLTSGCLINKTCIPDGEPDPTNSCRECISAQSSTQYSFISGKPCGHGTGIGQMCVANKCRGWKASNFTPTGVVATSTTLSAVAYVPAAQQVWASGGYRVGSTSKGGVLVQLSGSTTPTVVKATHPFNDLHRNMAVGPAGQIYYHNGTAWTTLTLPSTIGNVERKGVWGAVVGGKETYYMSGLRTGVVAAMYPCSVAAGTLSCVAHQGVPLNVVLGPVFGSLKGSSQGPLWSLRLNPGKAEDIYHNSGASIYWSVAPPGGCQDKGASGGTPCSKTTATFSDIGGSSSSDVWAVGTAGTLLHYDGSAWTALTGKLVDQTVQNLDTVYSSSSEQLVIIAGHRTTITGNLVVLFNYNRLLKRWYGPLVVGHPQSNNTQDKIRGIGGASAATLFMVGQRKVMTGPTATTAAWVLQLQ